MPLTSQISDEEQMLLYARELRRSLHLARQRERQLTDTNARLTRLDKLKSDFLHFVSHELRTPLQHFAALDVMDSSLPPHEMEEMLRVLRAGYDRLNRLVRAGVTYLEMAAEAPSCDLATFSASQYHRDLAGRCGALPRVELAPPAPTVVQVRGRIEYVAQIESILLSNALRFSEQSGQPVAVSAGLREKEWRLSVRDHGVGLPAGMLGEILEPFTIGQILHHQEGTGLSLARATLLSERMGGRLEATSDGPGCGATFVLRLPREGATLG